MISKYDRPPRPDRVRPSLRRSDRIILIGMLAAVVLAAVLVVLMYGGTP